MSSFAIDDISLFDLVDLVPELPVLVLPNNLLLAQGDARTTAEVVELHDRWRAERRSRGWDEIRVHGPDYVWSPTICGPAYDLAADRCHPVILNVDLRCNLDAFVDHRGCSCVGDLIYRHGCAGCGQIDPPRDDENAAAEDAMDHGWSGWRDLPVLAGSMPMDAKKTATWLAAAVALYPDGWIEAGGPIRTARRHGGGRHVPGRTPHGGYDLGAVTTTCQHDEGTCSSPTGVHQKQPCSVCSKPTYADTCWVSGHREPTQPVRCDEHDPTDQPTGITTGTTTDSEARP